MTDIFLSRPGVTVWPQLSKSVVWVAGAALYVALAMLATRWIAVHAERQPECGLRAIVLIFTAPANQCPEVRRPTGSFNASISVSESKPTNFQTGRLFS